MDTLAEAKIQSGQGVRWRGAREYFLILCLSICLGAGILLSVWSGIAFINMGYEIRALEQREGELLHLNRELEIEKGMLTSPERIEKVAREKLGMTDPRPDQIKVIR